LVEFEQLGLIMAQAVEAGGGTLIRVSTLLSALARRVRSPAETGLHFRLQADAEKSMKALLDSLGDLNDLPLQQAVRERSGCDETT
jgi:hypothetical protein